MNKSELITRVAINGCITKAQALATINAIQGAIVSEMKAGRSVNLIGFASFGVATRKARTNRDPRNGKPLQTPARRVPSVKFSRIFRDTF